METTRPSRNTFNQFVTGTLKLRPDRREIIVWQLAGFLKSSLKLVGTFTSSLFFITPATLIISRKDVVLGVAKTFTFWSFKKFSIEEVIELLKRKLNWGTRCDREWSRSERLSIYVLAREREGDAPEIRIPDNERRRQAQARPNVSCPHTTGCAKAIATLGQPLHAFHFWKDTFQPVPVPPPARPSAWRSMRRRGSSILLKNFTKWFSGIRSVGRS